MRVVISVAALSVLILAACGSSASSPAPGATSTASGAGQERAAAKPAESKPAPPQATSAVQARPAGQPTAAPAKPAADASESSGRASAPAAPAAAAQPPRPAPTPGQPAPPAPTPVRPADPAAVAPAQPGRMVIYTTEISVLVTSPSQLVSSLGDIVTQAGGYVAGVENKEEGGTPVTTVRLKVPPDRYEPTMRQIRGLAVEVTNEKASTQDVTEEFSDVQTQLAALEASHAQLLELMGRAQNVDEILKIQERLAQTKTQIDRLKGRQNFLQRSAELATISVTARPAEDVLARTFSQLRTSLRRAETQRAQTIAAIQRARTPEEEATLRDRLGEITLEIDRLTARIADVENKARAASITLPAPPPDDPAVATTDQDLVGDYLRLLGERRAAEAERDRLTREQRQRPSPEVSEQLRQAILRVTTLDTQVKTIEERARRAGVTLPSVSPDQLAALAGIPPEGWYSRLDLTSVLLVGLAGAVVLGAAVMIGRRLRRRPAAPTGPAPSAA